MSYRAPIDFARLNDALLQRVESLLGQWLPAGVERHDRWYVGDFDGGKGESANVNMLTGQWIDNGSPGDQGGDLISLYGRIFGLGNFEAAKALMDVLGWASHDDDRPVQAPAPRSEPQAAGERPGGPDDGGTTAAPAARVKKPKKWQPIVPVPPHAPIPTSFVFGYRDKSKGDVWIDLDATASWEYRFDGQLYGYAARFERINSSGELTKDTVIRSWCTNLSDDRGLSGWHWKQWDEPRPLFVPAGALSVSGLRPVVVVEGEKCAAAGHALLADEYDFVSWPGGCRAWSLAAWAWLQGRVVILWPDCDAQRERLSAAEKAANVDPDTKPVQAAAKQPGMRAMVDIGTKLQADLQCQVYLCAIPAPGAVAGGWDIADAIAEGWGVDRVRDFLRAATEFVAVNDEARAKAAATPSAAGAGEEVDADAWRSKLIYSSTGSIKACRENVVLALDGLPDEQLPGHPLGAGVIAFNEFTNNVEKLKAPPWGTGAGLWQEEDELELGNWLARQLYLPPMPRSTLEEAVLMVAKRHKFHPVRAAIESLRGKWDGTRRLSTWLRRVGMVEDEFDDDDPLHQYLARIGTWFVMGMVARVLTEKRKPDGDLAQGPGTKFDYMLVLEGPQGWGKSTIARVLGGQYFADTGLVLGEKDSYQNIQGVQVYEWGELDSMAKAEITKVKQFIASLCDRFRASFDRRPRDYPRQVVFVGTTNEKHYLGDLTGNRRFWPFMLEKPADLAWLRENREQLLAEALSYVEAGERFHPTAKEQRQLFDPQQQARTVESSIDSMIRTFLYDEKQKVPVNGQNGTLLDKVSLVDLLLFIGYSADKQTDVVMKRAGGVMDRLGWGISRPAASDDSTKRPRFYVRPPKRAADVAAAGASSMFDRPAQGTQKQEASDGCPV